MRSFTDFKGYERLQHSNLRHREIAYHEIYRKNRHLYPLPFSKYVIHHKNGLKYDNSIGNLEILTPQQHDERHGFNKPKPKIKINPKYLRFLYWLRSIKKKK